ncbi:unnamed protein product [marine sediment metagenome]|uniref:RecA family profile 2 domain-containing protein n=1 Tax=marine sediment metagenome TaxID=412755 RepID=X1IVS7_9ZZZZ
MFGNPETTPGGRALKFYSSVRIDIRRIGSIKAGDVIIGNKTLAKVVKNKVAPPFRRAEFDIMFDRGISYTGSVMELALNNDIMQKSGAWLLYNETKLGQGRERVRAYLSENPKLLKEIEDKVREKIKI